MKLRTASSRRKLGRFLIDGTAEIQLAERNGIELETIFVDATHSAGDSGARSWTLGSQNVLQPVEPAVLQRISYGDRGNDPVAVAVTPSRSLGDLTLDSHSRILVLDRTEKPGNLGACLRTASACGVSAVILTSPICELFNPNAIRASRGAVFTVPIAVSTSDQVREKCHEAGLPICVARVDGHQSLWDLDGRAGVAVVFGNEANGLSAEWTGADIVSFQIPMRGATDSLNLSISAAVTLYELFRQRHGFDEHAVRK